MAERQFAPDVSGLSKAAVEALAHIDAGELNYKREGKFMVFEFEDETFLIADSLSREFVAGDYSDADAVVWPEAKFTGNGEMPANNVAAIKPCKIHVVGNVGLKSCQERGYLQSILDAEYSEGPRLASLPYLKDVLLGTKLIAEEDRVEQEAGSLIAGRVPIASRDVPEELEES
jgi:hypothetical protein